MKADKLALLRGELDQARLIQQWLETVLFGDYVTENANKLMLEAIFVKQMLKTRLWIRAYEYGPYCHITRHEGLMKIIVGGQVGTREEVPGMSYIG